MSLAALLAEILPVFGTVCQITTASAALFIGVVTLRYTRQQNALNLISQNNAFANAVNTAVLGSADAQAAFGRLRDPILGAADDAVVVFMYLNYVHNTFRMRAVGAVSDKVWTDTLEACCMTLRTLTGPEVERFLTRGYEQGFRLAVLARLKAASRATASVADRVIPLPLRAAA